MAIPDYESLMLPVLRLTAEGFERIPQMLPHLKTKFSLSDDEAQELLPSGRTPVLASRAHLARTYLVKAGLLVRRARGVCEITERGRSVLNAGPERLNNRELSKYTEFNEWRDRSAIRQGSPADEALIIEAPPLAPTPDEAIEQAFEQLEAAIVDDVLARVLEITPKRFEELIVSLLVAMGYGGGMNDAGRAIGGSGDGGIDGVINEDPLGLDRVYVQAKRYALDVKVGRPAIQQFVGSLTGESATKGVFVTTSDFSADARAYADRVQQRIILIDGQRLARLMIAHEIGVRARRTYVLRTIDEDFFAETLAATSVPLTSAVRPGLDRERGRHGRMVSLSRRRHRDGRAGARGLRRSRDRGAAARAAARR